MPKQPDPTGAPVPCPFWRRLAAIVYDSLLLAAVVFIAWLPVPLVPAVGPPVLGRAGRLGYLVAVCFVFFGWCWTHGGQTLGMRAWRIRLVPRDGDPDRPISWRQAWLRFLGALASWAPAGLGFLWSAWRHDRLAWHDLFSRTRLVVPGRGG